MLPTRSDRRESLDDDTVLVTTKLVVAMLALSGLLTLVSLLPGVDRLIPGTPVSFVALIGAAVTLAVVGLLLLLAPTLAELVRSTVTGPASVVEDVAAIVNLFVVLLAVLVAHRGLAPAITPLLDSAAWTYDVVFLAFALPPLAILAARLYVSLDPISEHLATKLTGSERND